MHAVLSNGIAQNEAGLLLASCADVGIPFSKFREFAAADWKFCGTLAKGTVLRACFSEAREKAWKGNQVFRAGASEMLVALPIMLHFLHAIVAPQGLLADAIASFTALGDLVHRMCLGKSGATDEHAFAAAIERHARAFLEAYPAVEVKPKSHYIQHVPSQLKRDGVVLDAFVGERKHHIIKLHATSIKNTMNYERSVLLHVLAHQFSVMEEPSFLSDGLRTKENFQPLADCLGARSAAIGSAVRWKGTLLHVGDCLNFSGAIPIVEAAAEIDGELCLVVSQYSFVEQVELA